MNWIGGARNRVKFQGERKIQQEFFEKQRLRAASERASKKRRRLSQDLVALHTISKVHSQSPAPGPAVRRSIKNIDLEKFQSCTQRIDEVDMGPCSPSGTPSKLSLNDGQFDRLSGASTKRSSLNSSQANLMSSSRRPVKSTTEYQNLKQKTFQTPACSTINQNDIKITEYQPNSNITDPSKAFHNFSFSNSKQSFKHDAFDAKRKFDMFVSEDFQITPLPKLALKQDHKHKKSKHHKTKPVLKEMSPLHEYRQKSYQSERFLKDENEFMTSTPMTANDRFSGSLNSQTATKPEQSFKSIDSISPIMKETKHTDTMNLDDDFQFKPRYMYRSLEHSKSDTTDSTKSVNGNSNPTLCESVFHERVSPVKSSMLSTTFMSAATSSTIDENEEIGFNQHSSKTPVRLSQTTSTIIGSAKRSSTSELKASQDYPRPLKNKKSDYVFEDFQPDFITSSMRNSSLGNYAKDEMFNCKAGIRNTYEDGNTNSESQLHKKLTPRLDQHRSFSSRFSDDDHKSYHSGNNVSAGFNFHPNSSNEKQVHTDCSIMNLYRNAELNESSSGSMLERGDINLRPHSYGNMRKDHSPQYADVFPRHLMLPSNQNGETLTVTSTVLEENMKEVDRSHDKLSHSQLSQQSSLSDIKANSHLEELFDEMKHLEDQSATSQSMSYSHMSSEVKPMEAKTGLTHSQEADLVTELEDKLLSDIEHYQLQAEKMDKVAETFNEQTDDEVKTSQESLHSENHENKTCEEIPLEDHKVDESLNIDCETTSNMNVSLGETVTSEMDFPVKVSEQLDKVENIDHSESQAVSGSDTLTQVDHQLKEDYVDNSSVTCKGDNLGTQKCNIHVHEDPDGNKPKIDTVSTTQQTDQLAFTDIGSQTVDILPKQVTSIGSQTLEILPKPVTSIGSQTLEILPKQVVSIGTSPCKLQEPEPVKHSSIGTQCDFKDVPTLSSLCLMKQIWKSVKLFGKQPVEP